MPRKSKAQAVVKPASSPEAAYGQGQAAIQAQKAIPIPDQATRLEGALGAAAQQQPPVVAAAPRDTFTPALQAAQAHMAGPDALSEVQPHSEPMTSGLSTGPGPNALSMENRSDADLFNTMYRITGDPDLLLLAQRTRMAQQGM